MFGNFVVRVLTTSQTFELCWKLIDSDFKTHHELILEGTLASLKGLPQKQTGRYISPAEIHFCWPAPLNTSEYERVFDTHLVFNQPPIKAVYDRNIGELPPCKIPNSEMLSVLENHVRDCFFKECAENPYSSEVLKVLKKQKGRNTGNQANGGLVKN
ncbi:AraC family transcriptional regulator [bacterium]|nr:AraC family transcriptional regulator [bacterium]